MPKVVDPVQRRRHIFDALFDVVAEHGIEQVSLRRVADAAGLAIGSVRHYFDSQADLLAGAATELIERISARLQRHREKLASTERDADGVSPVALDMLGELLPLEPVSTREVTVWLELSVAARTVPALRPAGQALFAGSRTFAAVIVRRSGVAEAEVELAAERLAALVDGLAMRAALYPDQLPHPLLRAVLRAHLAELRRG